MADPPDPDRIALRGVRAHAHHGVYPFERERGQMFSVDAVLEVDTRAAAAGDDLDKTVNYAELAQKLHAVLTGEPVNLLETLAQRLADVLPGRPARRRRRDHRAQAAGRPRRALRRRHRRPSAGCGRDAARCSRSARTSATAPARCAPPWPR